ncbi:MAG: UDP-N-acetylglucosamine 2-epimerase (non-hydrolyzing) [Candidatus Saccharibacteria bacterium]|nr:UDP-N-acetylglucosamine 2-epimerase (non-hydrolyzing) [Candidatus Saccharibacteria bacterium]
MNKVLCVFGTRPEAIKMAPVVMALRACDKIEPVVCVTAQHRDMLDQVLEVFDIKPDYDLNIMKEKQTLGYVTTRVLERMDDVLKKEDPDLVLVHGDTTTAMATSLAAFYNNIRIGHVEAGFRTYDKRSPFPEEVNRQFIDRIADYLFAPTEGCKNNVVNEQLNSGQRVIVTGNTVIDALKTTVSSDYVSRDLDWIGDSRLILVTVHRRESFGRPMGRIMKAIRMIVDEFSDVKVIFPMHLNPEARMAAKAGLSGHERIKLVEPLDVVDFHNYMNRAYFIMSDSGGVQEEAPSLDKPVIVLREKTERIEGVEAGALKVVGTLTENIYRESKALLDNKDIYDKMAKVKNPYGDGFASDRIVDFILKNLS